MFIRMTCETCGIRFKANVKNAGKRGRCPNRDCEHFFIVPVPSDTDFEKLQSHKSIASKVTAKSNQDSSLPVDDKEPVDPGPEEFTFANEFGNRKLSDFDFHQLADEVASQLGWDYEESKSRSDLSRPEFYDDRFKGSYSYLQPCGVMPIEAIYFLREQKKISRALRNESLSHSLVDTEKEEIELVSGAVPEASLATDDLQTEIDPIVQSILLRKRQRRTFLRRAVVILVGTFILCSVAAGFIFLQTEDDVDGPVIAKASVSGESNSEIKVQPKNYPDVPPPPGSLKPNDEVEEEEVDPDAVSVLLVGQNDDIPLQSNDVGYNQTIFPFVKKYCLECHSGQKAKGEIDFKKLNLKPSTDIALHSWEKILAMLDSKEMPPKDHAPSPQSEEVNRIADWISENYFNANCDEVSDSDQVVARLLNRLEYSNTIRDLIGLEIDLSHELPSDELTQNSHVFDGEFSVLNKFADKYRLVSKKVIEAALAVNSDGKVSESHQRIIFIQPGNVRSPQDCFQKILSRFAGLAYRRPVTNKELGLVLHMAESAYEEGKTFEESVKISLQEILTSPEFLLHQEEPVMEKETEVSYVISQYEMASRLSYFLWSSMPDQELFELANENKLFEPDVIKGQVTRMLADPKSKNMVKGFAEHWLHLSELDNRSIEDQLKILMQSETELFLAEVIQKNRSLLEILTADYTFLNEELAIYYDIADVKGNEFRRVELNQEKRKGLLTQGSVLVLNSGYGNMEVLNRGKWVLENILASPPPPPVIPGSSEPSEHIKKLSFREYFNLHLTHPTSESDQAMKMFMGNALSIYDSSGRWRSSLAEGSVKKTDDEQLSGLIELISLLKENKKEFGTHISRQLLSYALGRELLLADDCVVNQIVRRLNRNGFQFSYLVSEIVLSPSFMKRKAEPVLNKNVK